MQCFFPMAYWIMAYMRDSKIRWMSWLFVRMLARGTHLTQVQCFGPKLVTCGRSGQLDTPTKITPKIITHSKNHSEVIPKNDSEIAPLQKPLQKKALRQMIPKSLRNRSTPKTTPQNIPTNHSEITPKKLHSKNRSKKHFGESFRNHSKNIPKSLHS